MIFFIALGVLAATASVYLVHQFASGTLTRDASGCDVTSADSAIDAPRETLKAA